MSDLLMAFVLHGLLLAAGAGVLRLAGARVSSPSMAFAAAGLAYVLGLSVVFAVLHATLAVGIPFTLPVVLGVAVAFSLPALLALPAAIGPVRATVDGLQARGWRSAPLLLGTILGATFLFGVAANATVPLEEYDAWAIWTHKAVMMAASDALPTDVFTSPAFVFAHPDYPLAMPLWEAAHFRAIGRADTSQVHALMWVLLPAWIGGAVFLSPRRAPAIVVVPVAGAAGVLVLSSLGTAYADAPLGIVLALAVLAVGRWILEGERTDLVLGTVLLGGAALLKNEGVVAGVVVFVALAFAVRSRSGALRTTGIAAGAWVAAFVAPWKVWVAVHDIHSDLPLGKALNPGYLIDRADRLEPTWRAMVETIAGGGLFVVPVVALVALALFRGGVGVRAFATVVLLGYAVSLVVVYWISPYDIAWHLGTSVSRVLVPLGMVGVSVILLLSAAPDDAPPPVEVTTAPDAVPDR